MSSAVVQPTALASGASCIGRFAARIAQWMRQRWSAELTRSELRALTDIELKDIGLFRGDIERVAVDNYR